ncbi:hypothetical protein M514_06341 [Trichuris suis]|uniref:Reverse transcriptase domain-containing protein n=1 Tax=Trichuris suis TaxID=68888 RepID=A0A085M6K4_9BILA|nr:hypothetical protein M513_06341 [Trichuris suis]KFD60815.1 hypothetical protein M514_06341 [Trichuris suis]
MEQPISLQLRKECYKAVQDDLICFNLYAEYVMRNAQLKESELGIKIAGKDISYLRYANDTILMAESEVGLKKLHVC